jgi:hypothetical protein
MTTQVLREPHAVLLIPSGDNVFMVGDLVWQENTSLEVVKFPDLGNDTTTFVGICTHLAREYISVSLMQIIVVDIEGEPSLNYPEVYAYGLDDEIVYSLHPENPDFPKRTAIGSIICKLTESKYVVELKLPDKPVGGEGGVTVHNALTGRDAVDSHPISAITGLQSALDANPTHNELDGRDGADAHPISAIEGLQTALDTASAIPSHSVLTDREVVDSHPISAITGLQAALDTVGAIPNHNALTARDVVDAHPIAAITNLQTALDSIVTVHNDLTARNAVDAHPISAITDLQAALNTIVTEHNDLTGRNDLNAHSMGSIAGLQAALNTIVTEHNGLTGRDAVDTHPMSAITGLDVRFANLISSQIDLGHPPVDGDRFIVQSTEAGAIRSVTLSEILNNVTSGLDYKGSWNPSTNTPTLNDTDDVTNGAYYKTSENGTVNLGSGDIAFNQGDWVIHNGDRWEKLTQTDQVNSVFGRLGAVMAQNGDYNAGQITVDASAFNTNLTASDDTVQKVAAKVDALDLTQRSITYNTTSQTGAIAVAVDTFYMNCNPNGSHDYTFPTASEGDLIGFRIRGTSDVIIPRFVGIIEGNENVFVDSDGDYTFVYAGGQWVATLGGVNYVY